MSIKISFGKDKKDRVLKTIKIPVNKIPGKFLESFGKKETEDGSGFILRWEQQLGFNGDPFKQGIIEPISDTIANLDREREALNMFIVEKSKVAIVLGNHFTGKTILLKWLEEQLRRYKTEIITNYVEGSELKLDNLEGIILKPFNVEKIENFDKIIKQKLGEKRYILIIDDLDKIQREIALFFNKLLLKNDLQIILSSRNDLKKDISDIKEALKESAVDYFQDAVTVNLEDMSFDCAKEVIQKRIQKFSEKSAYPLDEVFLKKIWKEAGYNLVKFLELCRKQAIAFAIKKSKGINIEDVVSYEKDGIDISKIKLETKKIEDKDNSYKIEVINRAAKDIVIEEIDKKAQKKAQKYEIKKVKNEELQDSNDAR